MGFDFGVIGGADGPTSVLVGMAASLGLIIAAAVIAAAVVAAVIIVVHFNNR